MQCQFYLEYTKKAIGPYLKTLSLSLIDEMSNFVLGSKLPNNKVIHKMKQFFDRTGWLDKFFVSSGYYHLDKEV